MRSVLGPCRCENDEQQRTAAVTEGSEEPQLQRLHNLTSGGSRGRSGVRVSLLLAGVGLRPLPEVRRPAGIRPYELRP
jgi:hypothetical protein